MPARADNKTKELFIYISNQLKDKPNYGSTLLNKAFYFIDSLCYLKSGAPITNLSYIKQDYGPTPKPAQFLELRERLLHSNEIEIVENEYFGRNQKKVIPKREANMNASDKEEIILIDKILVSICDATASIISDYTHNFIAWLFAGDKEDLPFYTFLLSKSDPDSEDMKWALAGAQKHASPKRKN